MTKIPLWPGLGLAGLLVLGAGAEEPNQFRRKVIEGRDDSYCDHSFVHRFSYRARPEWQYRWDLEQQGALITAGSTTSSEMFVDNVILKDIPFDSRFFGVLRYQRQEDFDGRFDRLLTGVGVNLTERWSLRLFGTVLEHKENIDVYWELKWDAGDGNRLRLAWVMPDYLYNSKIGDESRYNDAPYTYFADGRVNGPGDSALYSWINWTPRVRLDFPDEGSQFDYDQLEGGLRLWAPVADSLVAVSALEAQQGRRNSRAIAPDFTEPRDLHRRQFSVLGEVRHRTMGNLLSYIGMRWFLLCEEYRHTNDLEKDGDVRRREPMPYAGLVWNLTPKLAFLPALYAAFLNNENYDPAEPEKRSLSNRLAGKLSLPLEYRFSEVAAVAGSASLQTNPGGPFGGFNVQFQVVF